MTPRHTKLLILILVLTMALATVGCVEKLPPENLAELIEEEEEAAEAESAFDEAAVDPEETLRTDFVPQHVPLDRLKGKLYDVYAMGGSRILLVADGMYIYDLGTGEFLAKNETLMPEAVRVSFQILDDTIARFGLNYELIDGEEQMIARTHAALYDYDLNLQSIVDPTHQYEYYKNLYGAGSMELSPDGEYLFYCGDMGVQRLHIESDEALPIQWYYEPMEAALGLRVLDDNRVLYGHHASAYDTSFQLRYEISDLEGNILWHKEVGDHSSMQGFGDKFLIVDASEQGVNAIHLFDPETYEETKPPIDSNLLANYLPGGDFGRFVTLISVESDEMLRLMTYDLTTGKVISKRQMAITTPLGEEDLFAYVIPFDDLGWNLILLHDFENDKLDLYYDRFLPYPED